jgi:hypothetical protein
MKVFISHARKDAELALRLARRMVEAGLDVWNPDEEIVPGENWAMKLGEALESSELMVLLLTPGAFEEDSMLQRDIEYALGAKKYQDRLLTVFVGATAGSPDDVPWILLRQLYVQVPRDTDFAPVIDEIERLIPQNS